MSQTWNVPMAGSGTPSADRSKINDALETLRTVHSGTSAPASLVAYMLWWDTTTAASPILKVRDSTNASWITIMPNGGSAAGGLLALTGGTMSGVIAMGTNKITGGSAATAAGDFAIKSQIDAVIQTATVHAGTLSASDEKFLIIVPASCTISDCLIVSELGVTSDATNFWTFQVRNLTAAVDLRSTAKSTNGAAITADTAYSLGLDQNLTPASAAVLEFQAVKAAAAGNLQELLICLRYKIAV